MSEPSTIAPFTASRWAVIAKREFFERVRTKWFIIGTLLGPLLMVAMVVLPPLLRASAEAPNRIAIVDRSRPEDRPLQLAEKLTDAFVARKWRPTPIADTSDAGLLAKLADNTLNSYLIVPADPLGTGRFVYRGDNASSPDVVRALYEDIAKLVIVGRGARLNLPAPQLLGLILPPEIDAKLSTGETEGASGAAAFIVGYVVMFLLYMAIVLYGVNVMRSVVEEKSSRVVELMAAAAKPRDLLAGKILGVGAVGLVQIGVWLGMAMLTLTYRDTLLGWFGHSSAGSTMPTLAWAQILVILVYFVLGYFFYASLYAAIGAMVSSDQDAQQAQMPVSMLLVASATFVQLVVSAPRGTAAMVATLIPFSSPVLMPMRYLLGGATTSGVLVSVAILLVSTVGVVMLAAKIYRVGILMYGKRPSLREVARWLRH